MVVNSGVSLIGLRGTQIVHTFMSRFVCEGMSERYLWFSGLYKSNPHFISWGSPISWRLLLNVKSKGRHLWSPSVRLPEELGCLSSSRLSHQKPRFAGLPLLEVAEASCLTTNPQVPEWDSVTRGYVPTSLLLTPLGLERAMLLLPIIPRFVDGILLDLSASTTVWDKVPQSYLSRLCIHAYWFSFSGAPQLVSSVCWCYDGFPPRRRKGSNQKIASWKQTAGISFVCATLLAVCSLQPMDATSE